MVRSTRWSSSQQHLMLVLAALLVVVGCRSIANALPPPYLQPEFDDKPKTAVNERNEIINALVYAVMEKMAEKEADDIRKEIQESDEIITKKTSSICHFKVCEMGKRRR